MKPVEENRGREVLVRLDKMLANGVQPTLRDLGLTEPEAWWMNNERLIAMTNSSPWKASTRPFVDTWIVVEIPPKGRIYLIDSESGISQTPAVTQHNYYLLGPSSRVNIGSTDQSSNIISETQLFSKMKEAVEAQISDPSTKARLLEEIGKGEGMQKKSPMYNNWFTQFVAMTADWITILQPFIPALKQLLAQQTG